MPASSWDESPVRGPANAWPSRPSVHDFTFDQSRNDDVVVRAGNVTDAPMSTWRWSHPIVRRRVFGVPTRGLLLALGCLASVAGAPRNVRVSRAHHDAYAFGGRIIPADSGALDGVRVVAIDARDSYEALVDSSGIFVGSFPSPPAGRVTLRVFSDSSAPRYHTSVIALGPGVPAQPTRLVLVPTHWRIRGGAFDGRDVAIDPVRATTRYGEGTGYWRLTRHGRLIGHPVTWVTDSFPLRVAFRHERRDPPISSSDSSHFWALAANLEQLVGRQLFRPASFEELDAGADGILVTIDRRMSAAGRTFITYDPTGRIYEALVTVSQREYLGQTRVAMHELLHAIGFGHTGAWSSVMGPNSAGTDAPSVEDIAYAQLYYAISRLQREREAPFGILEAGRDQAVIRRDPPR